ncbi:uncharacterized protein LOC117107484 [Anneissia japonica]|uniref:uncharacterized protein LOC117107484 n=1 Tax=Anneissia japonica TaxID=1529436 RepID=UPI001425B334|nr:uncharacterized protein LOC117107484 [Anneissia japonica]
MAPWNKNNCIKKGCQRKTKNKKQKYCDQCFQELKTQGARKDENKEEVKCLGCNKQIPIVSKFCNHCGQRVGSQHNDPAFSEGPVSQIKKPPEADVAALNKEKLSSQPQGGHNSSSATQPGQGTSGDQQTVLRNSMINVNVGANGRSISSSISEESKKNNVAGQSVSEKNREVDKDDDTIQYDSPEYMDKYGKEKEVQVCTEATIILKRELDIINTLHLKSGYEGGGDSGASLTMVHQKESLNRTKQPYTGNGGSGDSAKSGSDAQRSEFRENSATSRHTSSENIPTPPTETKAKPVFGNTNMPMSGPGVGYQLRSRGTVTDDHPLANTNSDEHSPEVQDPEGSSVDILNSSGEFLLTLCTEHQLAITNTFFNHKPAHKNSWMHPRSKHWRLIDYIIIRQRDLVDILDTRAMRGANCSTDHIMIRPITKFKVRRKMMRGKKSNYKLNISRIKDRQVQENLEKTLTERLDTIPPGDAENKWQAFKEVVCNASEEHLGIATKKQEDWFDENSAELVQVLDDRNQARTNMLNRNT